MIASFLQNAIMAGLILSLAAAPLGCFVIWRRMAYFGDSLSHSALLGVALSLGVGIHLNLGIAIVALVFGTLLFLLQRQSWIPMDSLLGILAHASLAIGIVVVSLSDSPFDLHGFLFGDLLTLAPMDLVVLAVGVGVILLLLGLFLPKLLLVTLSEDLAAAEGVSLRLMQALLVILLTILVAVAIRFVGILLMTSLLIIPAATARQFAKSPRQMMGVAILLSFAAVLAGIALSFRFDLPASPMIVVTAAGIFFLSLLKRA